jgi:hypothetical protein
MGTLGPIRKFSPIGSRWVAMCFFSHEYFVFFFTVGRVIARVQGQCQAFDFGLVFSLATMRCGQALRAQGQSVGSLVWNMC